MQRLLPLQILSVRVWTRFGRPFWKVVRISRLAVIAVSIGTVGMTLGQMNVASDPEAFRKTIIEALVHQTRVGDSLLPIDQADQEERLRRIGARVLHGAHDELDELLTQLLLKGADERHLVMQIMDDQTEGEPDKEEVEQMLLHLKQRPWVFALVNSGELNAFVSPMVAQTIFIHSALIRACDDDQLAFVLGHELGHMIKSHSFLKSVFEAVFKTVELEILAAIDPFFGIADGVIIGGLRYVRRHGLEMPLSRTFEHEADMFGLRICTRAGFHPGRSMSFFDVVHRLESTNEGQSVLANLTMDRTHPHSMYRKKVLEEDHLPRLQAKYDEQQLRLKEEPEQTEQTYFFRMLRDIYSFRVLNSLVLHDPTTISKAVSPIPDGNITVVVY